MSDALICVIRDLVEASAPLKKTDNWTLAAMVSVRIDVYPINLHVKLGH